MIANPKRVLITPLDWGLGHATRCVPVVKEFLNQGCEVQIATSGDALTLLKMEFPDLKFHLLTSYRAEYSRSVPLMIKIGMQLPKFLKAIEREHEESAIIIDQEDIDVVISDNRYGCWSKKIPSIFVGHQFAVRASVFTPMVNYFQRRAIRRFSRVWIPDEGGEKSLAGELISTKLKAEFIGFLSRMIWSQRSPRYQIIAIISGPEPQRTIFEEIVTRELKKSQRRCLLVQGHPGRSARITSGELEIVSHLSGEEMNNAILESEIVISRSGYSTIMDLAVLGKKAIFVATPGQPEQEYLATRLMEKKIAFSMSQDKFDLRTALQSAKAYSGFERADENLRLAGVIKGMINETH
ncbi:MAG TPA: glycosyltransferase [Cyclobacteriaceae bacterium]|jgi:uncharacterized protein (TIGR00661 family)|nr:glycosyltransferase [Cyclobacteriaceae bacterium]